MNSSPSKYRWCRIPLVNISSLIQQYNNLILFRLPQLLQTWLLFESTRMFNSHRQQSDQNTTFLTGIRQKHWCPC